jgi:uncharacterized DUF497 family protein
VQFVWGSRKASLNRKKHGIEFGDACTVFQDPLALTIGDPMHSLEEQRELTIGSTLKGRLIVVSHCQREGRIRIISARPVTHSERQQYEQEAS